MTELMLYGAAFIFGVAGALIFRPGSKGAGEAQSWSELTPGLSRQSFIENLRALPAKLLGRRAKDSVQFENLGIDQEFARAAQQSSGRGGVWTVLFAIGRRLRLTRQQQDTLRDRLSYVGSDLQAYEFAGLKAFFAISLTVAAAFLARDLVLEYPLALVAVLIAGFFLPEMWLKTGVARRNKAIVRLLPEVMDLLALCMGAGLDFLGSLNRVVAVKVGTGSHRKEPLLEELTIVIQEIKFGKRRSESLRAMSKRIGQPEISSFVRTLVQADRMGTPIQEVLASYCEDVRFERYNRAEKAALTAPVKILVPLIFCILPSVAIIVAAPIFLQFSNLKLSP